MLGERRGARPRRSAAFETQGDVLLVLATVSGLAAAALDAAGSRPRTGCSLATGEPEDYLEHVAGWVQLAGGCPARSRGNATDDDQLVVSSARSLTPLDCLGLGRLFWSDLTARLSLNMDKPHRSLQRWFIWALALGLYSTAPWARPNGFAAECGGCHYGQLEGDGLGGDEVTPAPRVSAVASTLRVAPGEQVELTVTVESTWADAVVAGFLVITDVGEGVFTPSQEGTGNVGVVEGEVWDYAIGHTAARDLESGTATFRASWTAPTTPGSYEFAVYGVTSDDGDGIDDPGVAQETNDSVGRFAFVVGVGCDLVAYYLDADMDGYGDEELLACDSPAGYVLQGGDCRDNDARVNPGAVELCSFLDENCDGEAMAPPTFYRDLDGDGYGNAGDILVETCTLPEGYAAQAGDCAPTDPTSHPGAVEVAGNGVDDNCNGETDELGVPPANTGNTPTTAETSSDGAVGPSPAPAPVTSEVGSTAPDTSAPTVVAPADPGGSTSGCRVASRRVNNAGLVVGLLLAGLAMGRRRVK